MVQDMGRHMKLNIGLARRKIQQEEGSFYQQIGLKLKAAQLCVMLKLGHCGK